MHLEKGSWTLRSGSCRDLEYTTLEIWWSVAASVPVDGDRSIFKVMCGNGVGIGIFSLTIIVPVACCVAARSTSTTRTASGRRFAPTTPPGIVTAATAAAVFVSPGPSNSFSCYAWHFAVLYFSLWGFCRAAADFFRLAPGFLSRQVVGIFVRVSVPAISFLRSSRPVRGPAAGWLRLSRCGTEYRRCR